MVAFLPGTNLEEWVSETVLVHTLVIVVLARNVLLLVMLLFLMVQLLVVGTAVA